MSGTLKTRRRKLAGPRSRLTGESRVLTTGAIFNKQSTNFDFPGTQITVSEGHQWPPPSGDKLTDRGGPFYTSKSFCASPRTMPRVDRRIIAQGSEHKIVGPFLALHPRTSQQETSPVYPPTLESSNDKLDEMGAEAIARCKPTNSVADLSTALGEMMREGLPSLIGSSAWKSNASSARKKAGGEYLNVQFGWMPLVGEINNVSRAIRDSERILAQYERDAGKVVRRRYNFPLEKTSTESDYPNSSGSFGPLGTSFNLAGVTGLSGKIKRHRLVTRSISFSGAFTYHLPRGYDSRKGLARLASDADILLGTKLTPEVLWNLAPWSWAVDWFSNTGDVISNLTDFKSQGLIMRYGYVMEHVRVTDTYSHVYNSDFPSLPRVAPVVLVTETKQRRPANPFGFGLSWDGLSPFQLSIAAALGLSRGK